MFQISDVKVLFFTYFLLPRLDNTFLTAQLDWENAEPVLDTDRELVRDDEYRRFGVIGEFEVSDAERNAASVTDSSSEEEESQSSMGFNRRFLLFANQVLTWYSLSPEDSASAFLASREGYGLCSLARSHVSSMEIECNENFDRRALWWFGALSIEYVESGSNSSKGRMGFPGTCCAFRPTESI